MNYKLVLVATILLLLLAGTVSADTLQINATTSRTFTNDTDANWAALRSATLGNWYYNNYIGSMIATKNATVHWTARYSNGVTFNTSVIPAGATITAANVTGYSSGHTNQLSESHNLSLIEFHPGNYSSLNYANDFAATNFTRYSYNVSNSSFTAVNGTVVFNLTASGLNYINRTGSTGFMMELDSIIDNVEPTYPGDGKTFEVGLRNTTIFSGMYIPRMYITYTTSGAPVANFTANVTSGTTPLAVNFTDSSTPAATGWKWYWYDNETVSSSLKSPQTTLTTGTYNVRLNASNSNGFSWLNRTSYVVVSSGVPVASFTASNTSGAAPLVVTFTDTTTGGTPTAWKWYWYANETVSNANQSPTATFPTGTYDVRLNASNSNGFSWYNRSSYISSGGAATFYDVHDVVAFRYTPSTWNDTRNGGGEYRTLNPTVLYQDIYSNSSSQIYGGNYRPIFTVDTSSLGANATITSASITGYTSGYTLFDLGTPSYAWVDSHPGNSRSMSTGDYDSTTFTQLTEYLNGTSFATVANSPVTWSLTPEGIAHINTTGDTSFMLESSWMISNTSPTWSSAKESSVEIRGLSYAGGNYKPYLTVYYTTNGTGGVPPTADFVGSNINGYAPLTVTFTDQSSGATGWYWTYSTDGSSWNDFTTPNERDPVQTFSTTGSYMIHLTATNAYGSDEELKTAYVTVSDAPSPLSVVAHFLMQIVNATASYPANSVYVSSFGVVGDGTDETARVQSAFNYAVANGNSTIVFPESKNITIGTIRFPNGKTLYGRGSTLFLKANSHTGTSPWTWIYAEPNTTIRDFRFDGNRYAAGNGLNTNGIMLQGGNTVMGNVITRVNSYSMFIYYSPTNPRNIYIADNTITGSKQYGLETGCSDGANCWSSNVTVINNTISGNAEVGIKIRGTTNSRIINNRITVGASEGSEPSGIRLYSDDEQNTNVTISRNTVTGIGEYPSFCIDSDNSLNYQISITDNIVSNCDPTGINIRFNNGNVSGNTVTKVSGGNCITDYGTGNTLIGNVCL